MNEGVWETNQVVGEVPRGTIYAVTDTGKLLSLWGAERGNYRAGMGGTVQEEQWHAEWLCVGAHVPSETTPALRDFAVALDDLYYLTNDGRFCAPVWASIDGVDQPGERLENGTRLLPYTLSVVGGDRTGTAEGATADYSYRVDTFATHPWISPATEAMPSLKLDLMMRRRRIGPKLELNVHATARISAGNESLRSASDLVRAMSPLLGLMTLTKFDAPGVEWMAAETEDGKDVSLLCRTGNPGRPDEPAGHIKLSTPGTWSSA